MLPISINQYQRYFVVEIATGRVIAKYRLKSTARIHYEWEIRNNHYKIIDLEKLLGKVVTKQVDGEDVEFVVPNK